MKKIIVLSSLVLVLASCRTTDPYTGEEKVSSTTKGAVGGAVAGAVVGQLAGKDTKSTVIGAAAGSAAGAGIGYYFDRQEAALREELARTGVGVKRVGEDKLELIMPGNLTFKSGSSAIAPESYEVLNSISKVLEEFDETSIAIGGHTDNTGNDNINNALSQERADAVYYYLNGRGVAKERMSSRGYGSSRPIADNSTADGRAQNRRVEIQIVGK